MLIELYQIKDEEKRQAEIERLMNRPEDSRPTVDESLYHRVFMGDLDCDSAQDILFRINIDGHRLFRGEKMGLTDVVEMETAAGKLTLLYDSLGMSAVSFDPQKTQKDENLIRVLVIEPHRIPYESEIENTLVGQQGAVEGLIQYLYNGDGTITVVNDESKINGMEGNRRIKGDVLVGPVFIAGDTGENLCSLTDEQVARYMERFYEPEDISNEEVKQHCRMWFFTW